MNNGTPNQNPTDPSEWSGYPNGGHLPPPPQGQPYDGEQGDANLAYGPPPKPPKKPMRRGTKIALWVAGGFVALIVVAGIAGGGGSANDAADNATAQGTVPPAAVSSTAPKASTSPAAPATKPSRSAHSVPPKPAAPKWVKLVTLTGSSSKSSDTITTHGGKLRVTYTFKDSTGYGLVTAAVYVLAEGVNPEVDGAVPDLMADPEGGKDSTLLRRDAGEYYVRVIAANTRYTITVEEQR